MEAGIWPEPIPRSAAFRPIYPAPTPDYVPLAYNPLYYVLTVPFGWVLGDTLPTLRFVAVLGMLGSGLVLYVVALDDITRSPRRGPESQRLAIELLAPARRPAGRAYVLTNRPLDSIAPVLVDLTSVYVLEADLGDRFRPLRVLPKRFDHGWPHYLYPYAPHTAAYR